ncbi:hypothetical protein AO242_21015 [Pseudomonas sp. ICMP 561]|nr:hypothetical protein AO242_21015 [Pseudomonas sp. ICMP 561]
MKVSVFHNRSTAWVMGKMPTTIAGLLEVATAGAADESTYDDPAARMCQYAKDVAQVARMLAGDIEKANGSHSI